MRRSAASDMPLRLRRSALPGAIREIRVIRGEDFPAPSWVPDVSLVRCSFSEGGCFPAWSSVCFVLFEYFVVKPGCGCFLCESL